MLNVFRFGGRQLLDAMTSQPFFHGGTIRRIAEFRSTLTLTLVAPLTDFSKLVIVHTHGQRRFNGSLRL